jgi:hypothetical protein
MRPSIALVVLALVSACGSNGNGNGNGNSNTSDMSGSGLTGAKTCSVVTQDCGSGQKCVAKVQGANMTVVGTTCVANGTVTEGQPCMMVSASGLVNDNCVAGTVCDNSGGDSSLHCRKTCSTSTTCSSASLKCAAVYTNDWGLCIPSCTPFGNDCPAGNDCSTTFDAISATPNSGVFACKTTGMGALFANCSSDTDCGANLACVGPHCSPICDTAHQCAQPPGDAGVLSCQSYVNLANGAGVCG